MNSPERERRVNTTYRNRSFSCRGGNDARSSVYISSRAARHKRKRIHREICLRLFPGPNLLEANVKPGKPKLNDCHLFVICILFIYFFHYIVVGNVQVCEYLMERTNYIERIDRALWRNGKKKNKTMCACV